MFVQPAIAGWFDDLFGTGQQYVQQMEEKIRQEAGEKAKSGATAETKKFFTTVAWVAAGGVVLYVLLKSMR